MTKHFTRLFSIAVSLVLLTIIASAQNAVSHPELPNFQIVSERFYRGAQPKNGGFYRLTNLIVPFVSNS